MLKRGRVNLKNILLVFMVLQPFFDSYILYTDEIINFVGFSPTTIVRFLLIGIIFVYLFFNKIGAKENRYMFIYGIIVIIYTLIHHFVGISIDQNFLYSTFRYSLIGELFYLLRLIYPFLLMYIIYLMGLTKKEFKFVIQCTSIIFCSILLFFNLTVLSKTSYFSNYIQGSIFDWFGSDISRYMLAGKGWYNSANQIGGLILVLFPIVFYYTFKELKIFDLIVLLLLILSSYSIGTRISCIGLSLVLIVLICLFYLFKIFSKDKIRKKEISYSVIVIIFSLFVFGYAPIVNLSGNNILSLLHLNKVVSDNSNDDLVIIDIEYDGSYVCDFLEKTSTNEEYYRKLYPCEDNIVFWNYYIKNGYYKYTNNRLMEKLITNKEYNKIDSLSVKLFGMSRSRYESAKIYLERDVIVHYYTLGIFGVLIFILPYFIICGYISIKKIINRSLDFKYICLISAVLLPILVSILTGHIIDELIVTLFIGFILGYLLYLFKNDYNSNCILEINDDKRKKVLFVVDENKMGGVSVVLTDILKKLDVKKYKIDVLVLHNSGDSLNDLGSDINIIYGTKFFEVIDYNLKDLIKDKKVILLIRKVYLIFLMKTCLIKNKIVEERSKILKFDYDVEIAFKDGFTAVFTAYGNSKKKIHWLHYEYKKYNSNGNYPKLFNSILPMFDKIVSVSNKVMNDFNDIYHLKNKSIVIENIVDTDRIIVKSNEKCNRKFIKNRINIVSVGRLHEVKGYDRLIFAVNRLDENEKKKIHISIYGDGLEKDKLQKLIDEYKLNGIISLDGRVDNPYKYIKGNDLFILTSRFEAFGLVIVESMSLGVPVFTLENSSTNELIKNDYNGYIVKNDDDELFKGLKYLINNDNKIKLYKKNLCDYKYDNDKIIDKINNLLK